MTTIIFYLTLSNTELLTIIYHGTGKYFADRFLEVILVYVLLFSPRTLSDNNFTDAANNNEKTIHPSHNQREIR